MELEHTSTEHKQKKNKYLPLILWGLGTIIVFGGGYVVLDNTGFIKSFKLAMQIQQQMSQQTGTGSVLSAEDQKVIEQLGKIMNLPNNIQPTMAIIEDAEKLREDQPGFFASAKNGDRLIIYPNQAIIFDATANKIVHVGPVQFGDQNQQPVATVPFAIYKGTEDVSKADMVLRKLATTFKNINLKIATDASNIYDKTLVIDLRGQNPEIQKIADTVGGVVSSLPEGEVHPGEDVAVLIIVGNDQQ